MKHLAGALLFLASTGLVFGQGRDKENVPRLMEILIKDKEFEKRMQAAAIAALSAALKDPEDSVRLSAARCLSVFGSSAYAALPAIKEALRTTKNPELKLELEKADGFIRGKPPGK